MPALNRVQLIGRLGRAPESHFTPTGKKVAHFSIAVSNQWDGRDGEMKEYTEWANIEANLVVKRAEVALGQAERVEELEHLDRRRGGADDVLLDRIQAEFHDPVEQRLQGVSQIHVNPKAGLTFATALRSRSSTSSPKTP